MADTRYLVGVLETSHRTQVFDKPVLVKFDWADGMVGMIPVFESQETAKKYANGKFRVVMIETSKDPSPKPRKKKKIVQ